MLTRRLSIVLALLTIALTIAAAAPWLLYWIGLGKTDGRPSQTVVATHDMQALSTRLRIAQPIQIEPISPRIAIFSRVETSARAPE
jgi:hypothetical protein